MRYYVYPLSDSKLPRIRIRQRMIEKGERAYLVLHIKEPRKGEDGGAYLDSEEPNTSLACACESSSTCSAKSQTTSTTVLVLVTRSYPCKQNRETSSALCETKKDRKTLRLTCGGTAPRGNSSQKMNSTTPSLAHIRTPTPIFQSIPTPPPHNLHSVTRHNLQALGVRRGSLSAR